MACPKGSQHNSAAPCITPLTAGGGGGSGGLPAGNARPSVGEPLLLRGVGEAESFLMLSRLWAAMTWEDGAFTAPGPCKRILYIASSASLCLCCGYVMPAPARSLAFF